MLLFSCEKLSKTNSDENTTLASLIKESRSSSEIGNYLSCVRNYSKLIELDSLSGEFRFERGFCLAQIDSFKLSAVDFQSAAELGYNKFESYYSLAVIFTKEIPCDSLAFLYLNKALELNPESTASYDLAIELAEKIDKSDEDLKANCGL